MSGRQPRRLGERLCQPMARLGVRLLCLVLLATIPIVALPLIGAFGQYHASLRQADQDLVAQRDHLANAITNRIAAADGVMRGLGETWPSNWADCGEAPRDRMPDGVALKLACLDPAPDCCLPIAAHPVSNTLITPELRRSLAGSADPQVLVAESGQIALVGALDDPGRYLVASLAAPQIPAGLLAWLVDAAGRSWPLAASTTSLAGEAPLAVASAASVMARDGTRLVATRVMLSARAFLVVARPAAPIIRAAVMAALQRLGEIGAMLSLSVLTMVLGFRYVVTRPLSRLRRAAAAWRGGRIDESLAATEDMPDELRELAEGFRAGAAALTAREKQLEAAMERADILAAEVHHRVKNNLQVVSSLLALQAQRITDGQARIEFETARDRIGALATLHRHMYAHHDPEAIDLGAFIEDLGAQLFASIGDKPGRRIVLDVAAPALRISSDQAVPLALIITEAVSAALKQGFPPGQSGRIAIRVTDEGGHARLSIEDDGISQRTEDHLRTLLLRGLSRQLGAELQRLDSGLALKFPLRPATIRPPPALRPAGPDGNGPDA